MTDLIKLLDKLCYDKKMDKYAIDGERNEEFYKDCEQYFKDFETIYDKIDRHMYSSISDHIDSIEDDAVDILIDKLSLIDEYAKYNQINKKENKCLRSFLKLYDHIKLEAKRSMRYRHMEQMFTSFSNEKKEASKMIEEAQETVKEAKDQTKHLSQQLIAILGIFAGIIVTFSFSITTIGEALANLTDINAFRMLFVVFALGVVFVNSVAVLMSFVAKLSGFSMLKKVPYIVLITANVVLITLMIVFGCLMK